MIAIQKFTFFGRMFLCNLFVLLKDVLWTFVNVASCIQRAVCSAFGYFDEKLMTSFHLAFIRAKNIVRLHQMHKMQTIVTDDFSVCQSVSPSVSLPVCHAAQQLASLCGGHSVQPVPNHFGLLLIFV